MADKKQPAGSAGSADFLDLSAIAADDLRAIIESAKGLKAKARALSKPLEGKVLAMIFDKPSTRTRVSFDVGMRQLGGETVILSSQDIHLGHGETVADTARVLSRFVDAIMLRTTAHHRLTELAEHAGVPVINALTDDTHPCQIMADILTFEEHVGPIGGRTLAWLGDGNNVLHSLMEASARFDFTLRVAVPESAMPQSRYVQWAKDNGGDIVFVDDPKEAVRDVDCVVTDTWVSMGQDGKSKAIFEPYQVNDELMAMAASHAIFMHCLPAHRNEEVTDSVMDGPQSVVFDEAENRLHAQKAILLRAFGVAG